MRHKRGEQTFEEFGRKIGLSSSTLQRIEAMQQNVTLDTIEQISRRLRCGISEIFRD
jgi:DNA-binding Xre family transcriptional regulator